MKWRKLGRVFEPQSRYDWMHTHASNPIVEVVAGSLVRIYFSTRDAANRASVGSLLLDLNDVAKVSGISAEPLLSPGELGTFDDSGVSIGCLLKDADETRLYYVGWNLCRTVPWRNSVGLALRNKNGKKFSRFSRAPVMDRSGVDPFSLSYPWVLRDQSGYVMWYGTNLSWGLTPDDMVHVIRRATSDDGITWNRSEHICINVEHPGEFAISKPCVLATRHGFSMWYSFRCPAYEIGYAESKDGVNWTRIDREVGIQRSSQGWDSEGISYPCVWRQRQKLYMLYNGNGFGRSGFGLAVLEGNDDKFQPA
jgi:predicted GH43/DUF377 family glycosyl hydrolase